MTGSYGETVNTTRFFIIVCWPHVCPKYRHAVNRARLAGALRFVRGASILDRRESCLF